MASKKPTATYLIAACVAGSFALGLYFPNFTGAQGGLPERIASLRSGMRGRGLDPLNTYGSMLNELKDRYCGEIPADAKLTHAAVRGMLRVVDDPYTQFLDPEE